MSASDWNRETLDAVEQALFDQAHRTVLIQGGPGSGKTWTTAYLSSEAASRFVSPYQQALVLTFSVNAVNQITGQLHDYRRSLASRPAGHVQVTNYHSFYRSLLDAYARYCGISSTWRTWLPHEVEHVLSEVNDETRRVFAPGSAGKAERAARRWEASNALSIVDGLMDGLGSDETLRAASEVLREHHQQGLLHYDSWPYFAYQILNRCSLVREHLAARYPIILIDEFQDTNGIEWEFIRLLASESVLVCMTDPAQAIYQWRGANPAARLERLRSERTLENADGFELTANPRAKEQPGLREFALAIRSACDTSPSTPALQAPPNGVVIRAVTQAKHEAAGRADGEWPQAYANHIRRLAAQHWSEGGRMAILCPTWSLLGAVKWALGHDLPHSRGLRPDVLGVEQDIGCFLSALAHALAMRLSASSSERADIALSLEQLQRCAAKDPHTPWFTVDGNVLTPANRNRVGAVTRAVDAFCRRQGSPAEAVIDLQELGATLGKHMSQVWVAQPFLDRPLGAWVALLADHIRRNGTCNTDELLHMAWRGVESGVARERLRLARSRLVLMTMHASKGREFEHTIVCGASRNTRHLKPAKDHSDCATVRNLLMVACSRSRKRVTVLHKQGEPCCVLVRLRGEACPFAERRARRGDPAAQARMDFEPE